MQTAKIRAGIFISLILAVVVSVAISLYADLPKTLQALAQFQWQFLPLILGLTLFNYAGRFVKWQYYLACLGIRVPWWRSLLIFLSGLSMAITPGKVGELLKSYYLKQTTETPISQTAPIIFAERLTDGLAMILLATVGLFIYQWGLPILLTILAVAIFIILLIQNQTFIFRLLAWGRRIRLLSRFVPILENLYRSAFRLLRWRSLLIAVALGTLSWAGECGALYFVYTGLGIAGSMDLLLKAIFILAVSSLIGSASGLPGGLGTADGSVLVLTQVLVTPINALGAAATFIIRFCTLWFGLFVGVVAVLLYHLTQPRKQSTPPGLKSTETEKPITLSTQSGYHGN